MKCEACGGDGLIEVGAYRGDESDPNTRECRLCGGVVTLEVYREQVSGERKVTTAGAHLDQLAQRAGYADIHGMMDGKRASSPSSSVLNHLTSNNGVRVKDSFSVVTCSHDWDEQVLSTTVKYRCKTCPDVVLVSRTDGSVIVGDKNNVTELDKLSLSSRVMTRHPDYSLSSKTPADVAREYTQRLNEQNEREQQDAERSRRQRTDALRMVRIRQLKLTATCWRRRPSDDEHTLHHCRGIESQELVGSWVKFKPAKDDEEVTHVKLCAAQRSGACVIPLSSPCSVRFGDALQVVFTEPELETIISTFVK